MPSAHHGDVEIRWFRAGDKAGEPIVLVAGLGGTHRDWHRLVPYLEGFDVVLFDNRGTGLSSAGSGLFLMEGMGAGGLAVVGGAGGGGADVPRNSLGGRIAPP